MAAPDDISVALLLQCRDDTKIQSSSCIQLLGKQQRKRVPDRRVKKFFFHWYSEGSMALPSELRSIQLPPLVSL